LGEKRDNPLVDPSATSPEKLHLPVEVIGADLSGQQFFESAKTLAIHRNGVSIYLENRMGPDSEVILRNPETNEEAIAFIVGQIPEDKTGHVYGLAFLDPSANLWHIEFPTADAARMVKLECSGCHSVVSLSLSDIELEIYEAKRELTRSCGNCKSFMVWKETSGKPREKKPRKSAMQELDPHAVASPIEDRRKNRRAGMKTAACIQFAGMEVVVACEDISKGGFRFTCHKEYPKGIRVEAAAPYTKFSTNIFIPARIIYCHKIPGGKFRHGVTYLKNRGTIG
jgi:hypothetical protein